MGSALFELFSDIYIQYLGETLLNNLNFKCWLGYVDDTLILINNYTNISWAFNIANFINPHIQLMAETKHDNKLTFDDLLITRFKSHFQNSVYEKGCAVLVPSHALSNHPYNTVKMWAIHIDTHRVFNTCSYGDS